MKIKRDRTKGTIEISQKQYITKIAEKFKMNEAKGEDIPMNPDISFDVTGKNEHSECLER